MSWKNIIKQTELEAERGDDTQATVTSAPDRTDLSQAGIRVSSGTYKDLLDSVGQLWVEAKTATPMEQKVLFGRMRKQIREKGIAESD
tara:strand:- start:385 stop:648 length:264 start_codon:yes stop_codon:yes gene_type:complete